MYPFSKAIASIGWTLGINWKPIKCWFIRHNRFVVNKFRVMNQKFHRKVRSEEATVDGYTFNTEKGATLCCLIGGNVDIIAARTVKLYTMLSTNKCNCIPLPWLWRKPNLIIILLRKLYWKKRTVFTQVARTETKHMAIDLAFLENAK